MTDERQIPLSQEPQGKAGSAKTAREFSYRDGHEETWLWDGAQWSRTK